MHLVEIESILEDGEEEVFDLEVADDHSYIANGLIVHNSSPNLNNIPNVKPVKEAFVAPKGYKLLSADLSAQEVRVACTLARDAGMKDAVFTNRCNKCNELQTDEISLEIRMDYDNVLGSKNKLEDGVDPSICCPKCGAYDWSEPDPHSLVASRIYPELAGLELVEIKKNHGALRTNAKIVGFQILYGATAMAIAESVFGSSSDENKDKAQALIDQYLKEAPDLARAIEQSKEQAQAVGYVETIGGYRRNFPELLMKEPPKAPWKPKLDSKVEAQGCFGWADSTYDPNDPSSEMIGKVTCPRWVDGEDTGCPYLKDCQKTFESKFFKRRKNRALRQAFNALIQGTSADITNEGIRLFIKERNRRMLDEPAWAKVKVCGQIYDACYLYSPDELDHKQVYRALIEAFESALRDKQFVPQILEPELEATDWSQCH